MVWLWIVIALIALLFVSLLFWLYQTAFAADKKREAKNEDIPQGEQYIPYAEEILSGTKLVLEQPYEAVTITSFDGTKLSARYYEYDKSAPAVIFVHGYRSNAMRDSGGGFVFARELGYNCLSVDHRAHGKSEGKVITFGIKERRDLVCWVDFLRQRLSPDTPIALSGISMGGASVLMAAGLDNLPENVKCVIADSPYSSPKAILMSVAKQLKVPAKPAYALLKLSAKLIGGFDPDEASAEEAIEKTTRPILLIHGTDDRLVPHHMSEEMAEKRKDLITFFSVEKAGHGMSIYLAPEEYKKIYKTFLHTHLG